MKLFAGLFIAAIIAVIAAYMLFFQKLTCGPVSAYEVNATACLRLYAQAQAIYKKANYAVINGGRPQQYCSAFANLGGTLSHKDSTGALINLIPKEFANSSTANPFNGYIFINESLAPEDWQDKFGLFAIPAVYSEKCSNQFYVSTDGAIYMKHTGNNIPPLGKPFDPVSAGWERW